MTNREDDRASTTCRSVLITGGADLLGQAIVRELLKPAPAGMASAPEIRIFDVQSEAAPQRSGVANIAGDVRHHDAPLEAIELHGADPQPFHSPAHGCIMRDFGCGPSFGRNAG
jgi:nucleoside-diphosphate-sugar epimerase